MVEFNRDNLDSMISNISDQKAKRDQLRHTLKLLADDKSRTQLRLNGAEEYRAVFQQVAKETQQNLESHISSIATMALDVVGGDPPPPEFVVRIVERRGSAEMDLLFKEGDREQHPLDSGSHGYANIVDKSMIIAYIMLAIEFGKDIRKVLIWDEPFRDVQPSRQSKVSDMLHMMSDELGFQFLISSHADGVNNRADRVFQVSKDGMISSITQSE